MDGTNSDEEPSDDYKDLHENLVQTIHLINISLVIKFGKWGAYSKHSVQFPLDMPIGDLKKDIAIMVKIPSESQLWLYMNRELNDFDTLRSTHVPNQAIIEVKRS